MKIQYKNTLFYLIISLFFSFYNFSFAAVNSSQSNIQQKQNTNVAPTNVAPKKDFAVIDANLFKKAKLFQSIDEQAQKQQKELQKLDNKIVKASKENGSDSKEVRNLRKELMYQKNAFEIAYTNTIAQAFGKVQKIVEEISIQNKYQLVILNQGNIVYVHPSVDISELVIKRIDDSISYIKIDFEGTLKKIKEEESQKKANNN